MALISQRALTAMTRSCLDDENLMGYDKSKDFRVIQQGRFIYACKLNKSRNTFAFCSVQS